MTKPNPDLPFSHGVKSEARRRQKERGLKYTQALREVRALLGLDPHTGLLVDGEHSHLYREYGEPETIQDVEYQRYRCVACGDNTKLIPVDEI